MGTNSSYFIDISIFDQESHIPNKKAYTFRLYRRNGSQNQIVPLRHLFMKRTTYIRLAKSTEKHFLISAGSFVILVYIVPENCHKICISYVIFYYIFHLILICTQMNIGNCISIYQVFTVYINMIIVYINISGIDYYMLKFLSIIN